MRKRQTRAERRCARSDASRRAARPRLLGGACFVIATTAFTVVSTVALTSGFPAGAVGEPGASRAHSAERRGDAGGDPEWPPALPGTYAPPVRRSVSDPFRLDDGPYRAGNRGLEYETDPGDVVTAIGAGRVAFAGPVAGALVVSVEHPDGRRSMLTRLERVGVAVGDIVARGTPVGTAARQLHLGVREGHRYVDPAVLFGGAGRSGRAVLVPLESPRP